VSTPSGKPSHPIELSDYLARNAEPAPVESGQETIRSPYAPKSAQARTDSAPSIAKPDLPDGPAAYAPKWAKTAASFAPLDAAAGAAQRGSELADHDQHPSDAPLCPDAAPGGTHHPVGEPVGRSAGQSRATSDGIPADHLLDPDPAIPLQPSHATDDTQPGQADRESRDAGIDDHDLERLENSVRWLQRRQAAAMRLPRAPGLSLPPLRSALPNGRVGSSVGGDGREQAADAMRPSLRSLEPTRLTPPSLGSDRNPNTMLAVAVVCSFMAGVVVYLLLGSQSPPLQATSETHISAMEQRPSASGIATEPTAQPERRSARAPEFEPPTEAEKSAFAAATLPAIPGLQENAAIPRPFSVPVPADAQSPPASKPVRTLDPQEISLLISQGEKHVAVGDVVAARTVFQRAAQAGDATAALALAATFDPNVLARLGVLGMGADADAEKARTWYRTAEALGAAEATQRLQALDRR
jgi:hypothetical protein